MDYIQNNEDFAFSSLTVIQRGKFKHFVKKFLNAKSYGELERFARQLMNFVLYQHEKSDAIGGALESLNNFELYGEYEYKLQRLHSIHQANVFLLGLFLYHNSPIVKEAINKEMELTTSKRDLEIEGEIKKWRYSSQTKYGEFLYCWRLASLSHDVGNGISLAKNDKAKIQEYLDEISTRSIDGIEQLDDLWHFNGKDFRDQLDASISEISIKDYMNHQSSNPFEGTVYYDHGIISSLIFLRLMYEEYSRYKLTPISYHEYTRIIWHPSLLETSILQTAMAIALHNIEQYKSAFMKMTKQIRIFDLEKRSLSWLLKATDTLQEWDRHTASDETMAEKLEPTDIQISFTNNKIIVKDFPKEKLVKVKKIFEKYTSPIDLIKFE